MTGAINFNEQKEKHNEQQSCRRYSTRFCIFFSHYEYTMTRLIYANKRKSHEKKIAVNNFVTISQSTHTHAL